MDVCHDYKIPHSQFLAWSEEDREKAIWALIRARQTCGGCGTRADEWDPVGGLGLKAYTAKARLCHGCSAIETTTKSLGDTPPPGAQIVLIPGGVGGGR